MAMSEKEKELDVLIQRLTGDSVGDESGEYPLPEKEPIKYTNVDVLILPRGYKGYPTPNDDAQRRVVDSIPKMEICLDNAEKKDGVLSVPVTIASAEHVYDYDGLKVHKPMEELEAVATFADNRPVTRDHPLAGIVTDRREVLGFFRHPIAEENVLKGILEITNKDMIADIEEKKLTEVSAGFFCDLDRSESGESKNGSYDAIQKNIFLDHVAIVETGRCSIEDGCGIDMVSREKEVIEEQIEVQDALTKLKLDYDKIIDERNVLKSKLTEVVKTERGTIIDSLVHLQKSKTKADLEKLELDTLVKELDMVKEIKGKRLTVPDAHSRGEGRMRIDEVYAKIGGK
jgi:hypothetical protein